MARPCARPKKAASADGPSMAAISSNSGASGSIPRASAVCSSMKLTYMAPSLPRSCSRIACTSACAFS
jgi:hypothetical protein